MSDLKCLLQLQLYYAEHGVLPSYSTIATLTGYKAKSHIGKIIKRLIVENYLDLTPENKIKPGKRFFEKVKKSNKTEVKK
jgi:repressor LexA